MKAQLLGARRQLEKCGWVGPRHEPWCRDSHGRRVSHSDEGVQTFACLGALQLYGPLEPALELLGRVVSPGLAELGAFESKYSYEQLQGMAWDGGRDLIARLEGRPTQYEQLEAEWYALQQRAAGEFFTFTGWLTQASRTRDDVLRVLTTAAIRSGRERRP